jgi:peptide/nickel transport system substrate-binding protein
LEEAGYELQNGVMTAKATGLPFTFEMTCASQEQERLMLAYSRSLRQIGIVAQIRLIDSAQFQRRVTSFDFDMIQATWGSSLSPGNEQSFRWSKEAASEDGSFNYAGVQSAGADAMIAAMLSAESRAEFVSAVRALDRILLSGRYGIPLYYAPKQWIAAWSHVRHPSASTLYGARIETWWAESAQKAASSAQGTDNARQ